MLEPPEQENISASLLFSSQGILYPNKLLFSELFYKLGEEKKWVAGLGGGHIDYAADATERFFVADVIYYVSPWLVLQGGARHVQSSSANTSFQRAYGAITFIFAQSSLLLRYEDGKEAYAVIGTNEKALFNFRSRSISSAFTVPLGIDWQFRLTGEKYESESIQKNALGAALIHQF